MKHHKRKRRSGFTLMELLLVLGIIGILAAIVLVAINPTKQLQDARNTDRNVTMRELENAISQYLIDGNQITGIPTAISAAKDVCQTAVTGAACTGAPVNGFDLSALAPNYLVSIPIDPDNGSGSTITGYRIYRSGSFIVICSAIEDVTCGP